MKPPNAQMNTVAPPERQVDSRVAAAFLGVHYKTLERMARMGLLPAMKVGKSWQFLLSLLNEWRKEQMNSNLTKRLLSTNNKENE
jgi:excisionase family DNA binding protein